MQFLHSLLEGDIWSYILAGVVLSVMARFIVPERIDIQRWQCFGAGCMFLMVLGLCLGKLVREPASLAFVSIRGAVLSWIVFALTGLIATAVIPIWEVMLNSVHFASHARRSSKSRRRVQPAVVVSAEERRQSQAAHEQAERRRCEEAARAEAETARRLREQRHRESVRFRCETLYDRHRTVVAGCLPHNRFRQYLETYMNDGFPADVVEQRASELERLIADCVGDNGGLRQRFHSLDQLAVHFTQRKLEIALLNYDNDVKESILAALAIQEETAIREFLEQ